MLDPGVFASEGFFRPFECRLTLDFPRPFSASTTAVNVRLQNDQSLDFTDSPQADSAPLAKGSRGRSHFPCSDPSLKCPLRDPRKFRSLSGWNAVGHHVIRMTYSLEIVKIEGSGIQIGLERGWKMARHGAGRSTSSAIDLVPFCESRAGSPTLRCAKEWAAQKSVKAALRVPLENTSYKMRLRATEIFFMPSSKTGSF